MPTFAQFFSKNSCTKCFSFLGKTTSTCFFRTLFLGAGGAVCFPVALWEMLCYIHVQESRHVQNRVMSFWKTVASKTWRNTKLWCALPKVLWYRRPGKKFHNWAKCVFSRFPRFQGVSLEDRIKIRWGDQVHDHCAPTKPIWKWVFNISAPKTRWRVTCPLSWMFKMLTIANWITKLRSLQAKAGNRFVDGGYWNRETFLTQWKSEGMPNTFLAPFLQWTSRCVFAFFAYSDHRFSQV